MIPKKKEARGDRGESLLALESHPQSQYENIWTSRTRDLEEWERDGGGQRAQRRRKPQQAEEGNEGNFEGEKVSLKAG
jgi:hypothetical protein